MITPKEMKEMNNYLLDGVVQDPVFGLLQGTIQEQARLTAHGVRPPATFMAIAGAD